MSAPITRRSALKTITGTAAAVAALSETFGADTAKRHGSINHSVCRWCYNRIPMDDFCKAAKEMGIQSIELLAPNEWDAIKKYDLTCAMAAGADSISYGFNRKEHHDTQFEKFGDMIPKVANAGLKNLICFSGDRRPGLSDEEGLENCAIGLKRIMPIAEKHKVVIVMELLNSKVDHKNYMCDHTKWGAELVKRVGSENFKLLYDIYHMQIMEGDVIRTIRENKDYIAHYHTGGVPGRGEIDNSQELYYPAIMDAIVKTGFKGFVAQEFIPKRPDPLASLKQGVEICDVKA